MQLSFHESGHVTVTKSDMKLFDYNGYEICLRRIALRKCHQEGGSASDMIIR